VEDQTCALPCNLSVRPGVHPVIASGTEFLARHAEIPATSTRLEIVDRMPGHRLAGVIMIPIGLVMATTMWALGSTCSGPNSSACLATNLILWPVLGTVTFFTGLGLAIYGSSRNRYGLRVTEVGQSANLRPRLLGVGASPTANGAAMAASFSF
jgi:hypothetical protein